MLFPFLTVFIIFITVLAIIYRRNAKKQTDVQNAFWEREYAANAVSPVDLNSIQYITIPLEKFPLGFSSKEEILSMEDELLALSKKRLLNLTGKTNTELKELYGVPNLEEMTSIGENFDRLTILLKKYAEALIEEERLTDAVSVLEFGVAVKTDISQHYILLGECYLKLGKRTKIEYLIEQVRHTNLLLAPSIIRQLEALLTETQATSEATENFNL